MKIGTHVRLADGRLGTVVFNGLSGAGIKWGRHHPSPKDFEGTSGDCFAPDGGSPARAPDWLWTPDAMLRDPRLQHLFKEPCVGEDYEVISDGEVES